LKILIISDTHGNNQKVADLMEIEKSADMVIHCGDAEGGEYMIENVCGCPLEIVTGNNDFFSTLPKEREFVVNGKRFFLTHGHYYYVSMGIERILNEAADRQADVVLYGHTHRPMITAADGIWAMNPGSLAYPRQANRKPSYILMNISDEGEITAEIKFM